TDRAQGAWGFLKEAGRITLTDFGIESANEYGSIVAVSLDDQPLSSSKRVLIQSATWDQPFGFKTLNVDGYRRIENLGGFPLNVEEIKARVFVRRPVTSVMALDGNGYETESLIETSATKKATTFELPKDSLYVLIQ
ncbi:MAG: hypothetical protein AAF664_15980, partial [Planctomycetota bacterium]